MPLPSRSSSNADSKYSSRKELLDFEASTETNFPRTFQDFFTSLSDGEDVDDSWDNVLEEKELLPPKVRGSGSVFQWQRLSENQWTMNNRSFHKVNNELQTKASPKAEGKGARPVVYYGRNCSSAYSSPKNSHRRYSSNPASRGSPNRCPQPEQKIVRLNMGNSYRSYSLSCNSSPLKWNPQKKSSPFSELVKGNGKNAAPSSTPTQAPATSTRQKPKLADTKTKEPEVEYYRIRSFSITPNGVFNLGDSFRTRRSRSATTVHTEESTQTDSASGQEGRESSVSQHSCRDPENDVPIYRVGMLGAAGVGKTSLIYQFTTSDYAFAYDTSLDEELGQRSVSVLLNGDETELEIIDHPSIETSIENFCNTYHPDLCVVVYSIDDKSSIKVAEEMLMYLWKSDYMASIGVILVGNKVDLERRRRIPVSVGRKLANVCRCKFIETSSGLDHNVDELLVGIVAQVSLNPKRRRELLLKRTRFQIGKAKILKFLLGMRRKSKSCENLFKL